MNKQTCVHYNIEMQSIQHRKKNTQQAITHDVRHKIIHSTIYSVVSFHFISILTQEFSFQSFPLHLKCLAFLFDLSNTSLIINSFFALFNFSFFNQAVCLIDPFSICIFFSLLFFRFDFFFFLTETQSKLHTILCTKHEIKKKLSVN